MKGNNVSPKVDTFFHISEQVMRLIWDSVLRLPEYIIQTWRGSSIPMCVVDKHKYSVDFIESYVLGRHSVLSWTTIAKTSGFWNEGRDMELSKRFCTYGS